MFIGLEQLQELDARSVGCIRPNHHHIPETLWFCIAVLQANTPSVVNITNIRAMQSYYTMDIEKIPAGTGSGFIWDKNGAL